VVQAQDPFEQPEIITVLLMAENVFETGLWQASASENLVSTTATWQSRPESGFSGLSFLNYLHLDTGYTLDSLDELFDDDWFEETFAAWDDLRKTNVCYDDDTTLHEFTLAFVDANGNSTPYSLRYWVDPVNESRVRVWYISFATAFGDGSPNAEALDMLDSYSERMFPDLPDCPG
jgi:hypothetical protein